MTQEASPLPTPLFQRLQGLWSLDLWHVQYMAPQGHPKCCFSYRGEVKIRKVKVMMKYSHPSKQNWGSAWNLATSYTCIFQVILNLWFCPPKENLPSSQGAEMGKISGRCRYSMRSYKVDPYHFLSRIITPLVGVVTPVTYLYGHF